MNSLRKALLRMWAEMTETAGRFTQVQISGACGFCGYWHGNSGPCPNVEEIEYFPNGTVKRYRLRSPFPGVPTETTNDWKITVSPSPAVMGEK